MCHNIIIKFILTVLFLHLIVHVNNMFLIQLFHSEYCTLFSDRLTSLLLQLVRGDTPVKYYYQSIVYVVCRVKY